MSETKVFAATDVAESNTTSYPEPFRAGVEKRHVRRISAHAGLTNFGVNVVRVEPGGISSQRHWHSKADEFVMLLDEVSGEADPLRVADRIHAALREAFELDEHSVYTTASIGIAPGCGRYASVQDLIDAGIMFAGTPDQVYGQIVDFCEYCGGMGNLIMMGHACVVADEARIAGKVLPTHHAAQRRPLRVITD